MTVQDLINKLKRVKDKSREARIEYIYLTGCEWHDTFESIEETKGIYDVLDGEGKWPVIVTGER